MTNSSLMKKTALFFAGLTCMVLWQKSISKIDMIIKHLFLLALILFAPSATYLRAQSTSNTTVNLCIHNNTSYTVQMALSTLPEGATAWVQSQKFIKIKPGATIQVGTHTESYFYLYAQAKVKKEYITWQGTEEYFSIKNFGQFGCLKITLDQCQLSGEHTYTYEINVPNSFQYILD